jgi:hypothetical protein
MPVPDRRVVPTTPTRQYVQAFTIERPDGVSLLMRVLPGGSWRLREYDADGDEQGCGHA